MERTFAEHRILEKIATFPERRQRDGLKAVDLRLAEDGATPSERLHYIALITNLSRIAAARRMERAWHEEDGAD